MRRNSDDEENPFGGVFDGIDQMNPRMADDGAEHITVHEYDDRIAVVADIPGVDREDIDLHCDGRNLAIRASSDPRPFFKRVDLPTYVDDQSIRTSFNNGVLEVTLDRDNDPANIGFQ